MVREDFFGEVRYERKEDINPVKGKSKRVAAWVQHVQGSCGRMEHAALKGDLAGRW